MPTSRAAVLRPSAAAPSIDLTSSLAHDLPRRPRPGWLTTAASLILAALATLVVLAVPALGTMWLGLVDSRTTMVGHSPAGFVTSPFYPGGAWAVATDVAIAVFVAGVGAVLVQRMMSRYTGFHLSRWSALGVVVVGGWWPLLGVHPIRFTGGLGFIGAVVLARYQATDETMDERWPVVPLVAATAVAVGALFVYVGFHPIRVAGGSGVGSGPSGADHQMFEVRNAGLTPVTLLGLSVPAAAGMPRFDRSGRVALPRLAGTRVAGRSSLWITLARAGCPPRVVTLRYRVFGLTLSEPVVTRDACLARG